MLQKVFSTNKEPCVQNPVCFRKKIRLRILEVNKEETVEILFAENLFPFLIMGAFEYLAASS